MKNWLWKIINYVEDRVWVLDNENLRIFNDKFFDYETEKNVKILNIFFENKTTKNFLEISKTTFFENNLWKNGVLLLVSIEDKKIEILTWFNLQKIFTREIKNKILENLKKLLRKRDYDGILEEWFFILENISFENTSLNRKFFEEKKEKLDFKKFFFGFFMIIFFYLLFMYFIWNIFASGF